MNRFLISFSLIFIGILACNAQTDCVYNDSSLTDAFLKTAKQIDFYKWDTVKKEGMAILNDGSVLKVKKWACNHIGTSANMMMSKEKYNPDFWKDYVIQLAAIICNKQERKMIDKKLMYLSTIESLNERNCKKEIDLSDGIYSEFYVSIYELEDTVVFSIFFYMTP